ncbi:MAG: UDP-N-acetylmuramate dehydrogenase [Burkholderiaceae bacterium]
MVLSVSTQDLTSFNTLQLHSRTRALVRYISPAQLGDLSRLVDQYRHVFVLGGGSNVVLAEHLGCLVIKVESRGVRVFEHNDRELIIEAQAGEIWHDFVSLCVASGWDGLENLALIPGTAGAAPVQNIGAYGVELEQRFHSLSVWDLRDRKMLEMGPGDCKFSYRDSFFKRAEPGRWLITAVRFRLPKPWKPVLEYSDLKCYPALMAPTHAVTATQIFDAVCEIRRAKLPDPARIGNAGSFFKNPIVTVARYNAIKALYPGLVAYPQDKGLVKLAAGWLIDQAGWKGRRMGKVGVHDRQALVLINHGGANADDIALLARAVRSDVAARFGVQLEQEPIPVS